MRFFYSSWGGGLRGESCASGMVVRFVAVAMPRGRLCFGDGGVFRGLVFMAWCSSYHTAVWGFYGQRFLRGFYHLFCPWSLVGCPWAEISSLLLPFVLPMSFDGQFIDRTNPPQQLLSYENKRTIRSSIFSNFLLYFFKNFSYIIL